MNRDNIKDYFSADMDNYFKGENIPNKMGLDEPLELIELGKKLSSQDFSRESEKEEVLNKIKSRIKKSEDFNMNRTKSLKRITITAATVTVLLITLMQTTFAQDFVEKIIKSISLGNINAIQVKHPDIKEYKVPDELKGKIFDKNGNPLEVITEETRGELFTAEGEKIVDFSDGQVITEAQKEKMAQEGKLVVKDSEKLNDYTCFKVILPGFLPNSYEFDRAEFYKDETGAVNQTKYIDLYFQDQTTGNYIYMQQRFSDEETAYEFSTDGDIEKIKINDSEAVLFDGNHGKCIDWEYNGVLYGLNGRGNVDQNDLIKIAESIK